MNLKNILIVVKDIEKSRQFYRDMFGLEMVLDNDGNMILTEGLVLQDEKIWKELQNIRNIQMYWRMRKQKLRKPRCMADQPAESREYD